MKRARFDRNSAAWTCCKLTYLETEDDVNTFNEAPRNDALDVRHGVSNWDECGYLPTQKLFSELTLKNQT